MKLPRLVLLCTCLLVAPLAGAHQGHDHKPKPKPQEPGKPGKPVRPSGRTALAEAEPQAEPGQSFCMKNREGKLHCIPFGAH